MGLPSSSWSNKRSDMVGSRAKLGMAAKRVSGCEVSSEDMGV